MAASMANGCRRFLHNSAKICWKDKLSRNYASSTGAYFVFLPEVPLDTAETNPIMRHDELPSFTSLHNNNIITGCAKLSFAYDLKYEELLQMIADEEKELDVDEFFLPLEEVLLPMQYSERTVNMLFCTNPKVYKRGLHKRILEQINRARSARFFNNSVYSQCLKWSNKEDLSESQRRLVNWYMVEGKFNGADLGGNKKRIVRKRYDMIMDKEKEFLEKTIPHAQNFQRQLTHEDYEIIKELPKHVRLLMAQDSTNPDKGPWTVSLNDKIFEPFMEYCPRRGLRSSVWVDKHLVGSHKTGDIRTHTFQMIDDIRLYKNDIAKEVGYSCYAEMVNENKMAESVEAVQDMFQTYKEHFLPMAEKEISDLKGFIAERGLDIDLQQWDIPYFKRLHAEQLYRVNRIDKRQYFNLDKVLETLFSLVGKLFQVNVEISQEPINKWHSDVKVVQVHNLDGKLVGTLFMDLFLRIEGKMWITSEATGRDYSQVLGLTPISYLTMELTKSNNPEIPHTLSYKEILQLFYHFGYSMRNLLAQNPYGELNNTHVMEYDVVHTLPHLLKMFAKLPSTVRDMSDHVLSGEKLSDRVIDNLVKCQDHMIGYDMCYQIFYSACDIEFHSDNETYWKDIQQAMYKEFMPLPINFEDWGFCSDPTLWIGRTYSAQYYSMLWSQMLAANVFESFKEAGLDNEEAMAKVGMRFRSTFLAPAAGSDPLEKFRHFKGCNPSLEALSRQYPSYPVEENDEHEVHEESRDAS